MKTYTLTLTYSDKKSEMNVFRVKFKTSLCQERGLILAYYIVSGKNKINDFDDFEILEINKLLKAKRK